MLGKKKLRGSALIAQTFGKFEAMIVDLQTGCDDCGDSIAVNKQQINQLQSTNTVLNEDCRRANVVIGNLKELVADH